MPVEKRGVDDDEIDTWQEKKTKRRSRWAKDEADKTFIPGMPTSLPADASEDQKEQYLLQLQIEDISRRLRSGELGIPQNAEDRSPSPEPIYNSEGKRMNTREYRVRKQLEEERHEFVKKLMEKNPGYKPPSDYKPPIIRVNDKVMIPQDEHPEINFVGLLIGPRGNTLKNLEKDTGAKIIIRGKGSVKEGKIGRKDGQPLPGEDEPLHAYITASNPENVQRAVNKIKEIIQQGIEVPEEQNDLRKKQLRELALLNGTLREDEGLAKLRQLAEAQTILTNTILCSICGGAGHIAKDCMQRRPGDTIRAHLAAIADGGNGAPSGNNSAPAPFANRAQMDSEYMSLMAELGQSAPGPPPSLLRNTSSRPDARMGTPAVTNQLSSDYGYGGRRSRFERDSPFQQHARMPSQSFSSRPMQAIMAAPPGSSAPPPRALPPQPLMQQQQPPSPWGPQHVGFTPTSGQSASAGQQQPYTSPWQPLPTAPPQQWSQPAAASSWSSPQSASSWSSPQPAASWSAPQPAASWSAPQPAAAWSAPQPAWSAPQPAASWTPPQPPVPTPYTTVPGLPPPPSSSFSGIIPPPPPPGGYSYSYNPPPPPSY